MSKFSHRSDDVEWMDDLNCSGAVVERTLHELEVINRLLGGNAVTLAGIAMLVSRKKFDRIHITDLGCGRGDMLLLVGKKLKKMGISGIFLGVDFNPNIVDSACLKSQGNAAISFEVMDVLSHSLTTIQTDIALATLFFHHFTAEQLVQVLRVLKQRVRIGIVINDLHRHWLAYYSIKILTRLFSRSPMVQFDAPLSVLRGFSRNEWKSILEKAGIKQYSLKWKWAFRWQIIIRNQAIG